MLDVEGALNHFYYAPTNSLIQVPDEKKITTGHCEFRVYDCYIWFLRFDINKQSGINW